jgi:hypothetical protein
MPEEKDDKNQKSNSFKKLEDLLKIDGDGGSFDDKQAEEELKKIEERKNLIKSFKEKFKQIEESNNTDDYMNGVLKEMISKGMSMLTSLEMEILDAPRGRDVETAAAMMTAINSIISNINNIKIYNAKIDIERQKLDLKKNATANLEGASITNNQNILMVGSTNELQEFLINQGILPGNPNQKPKEVNPIKTIDEDDIKS